MESPNGHSQFEQTKQHYYSIYSERMPETDAKICADVVARQTLYGSHNVNPTEEEQAAIERGNQAIGNWTPNSNYPRPQTTT
jgi:hypothetical protein